MNERATALRDKIVERIVSAAEYAVFSARDFRCMAPRVDVDAALAYLANAGTLRSLGYALYDRPRPHTSRFLQGDVPPNIDAAARAYARSRGHLIATWQGQAANTLHLSTQVPARYIFLTSGPTAELQFGRAHVELQHHPTLRLEGGDTWPANALRAIVWQGPYEAERAVRVLDRLLPAREKMILVRVARRAGPDWVNAAVAGLTLTELAR